MTETKKTKSIKVRHFMNSSFKEFSLYDNVRSIPTIFDGLKVSQRKAIYGAQQRGENAPEIQVERISSQIAAVTDYHHGVGSLESTIIGMANNYAGTNNMNLFVPSGQFGSRLTKESAASRYIFTKLSPYFRQLFKKEDDSILENIVVDGEKIEPKHYIPLLPLALVNGAQGTGTGHACLIMNYHPIHVRDAILAVLSGKSLKKNSLTPWFRGFKGAVVRDQNTGQVVITGKLEVVNSTTIKVTELPVGVYLDQYKDHLQKLEDAGFIKDFEDHSSEDSFEFVCSVPRTTTALDTVELYKKFKLVARDTENLTLWNTSGTLKRYDCVEDIIEEFTEWRVARYEDRRVKLISETEADIEWSSSKIRFIQFYLKNTKLFKDTGKADLVQLLKQNDFHEYEKLLSMPIWNLTRDKILELEKELDELKTKLDGLVNDTAADMYKRELKQFTYA